MAEQPRCQRHGRPARPQSPAAAGRDAGDRVPLRARSRRGADVQPLGGSLFDDFFSDFFGDGPTGGRVAGPAQQRQVERVDVTSSSVTPRASCCSAPRRSPSSGAFDLDTDHLLYAALQDGVVRHVLDQIDADPEAISAQLEEEVDKGGRTDVSVAVAGRQGCAARRL